MINEDLTYDDGYNDGFMDGKEEGYDEGYEEGIEDLNKEIFHRDKIIEEKTRTIEELMRYIMQIKKDVDWNKINNIESEEYSKLKETYKRLKLTNAKN